MLARRAKEFSKEKETEEEKGKKFYRTIRNAKQ